MTWAKIDDRVTEHPKFEGLDDAGWSLWLRGLVHACRYKTDGVLAKTVVQRLGKSKTVHELVRRRIWEAHPGGGVRIHDFLDYQVDHDGNFPPGSVSGARQVAGRRGAQSRWSRRKTPEEPAAPRDAAQLPSPRAARDRRFAISKPMAKSPICHTANDDKQPVLPWQNLAFAITPGTPDLPISREYKSEITSENRPKSAHTAPVAASDYFKALRQKLTQEDR